MLTAEPRKADHQWLCAVIAFRCPPRKLRYKTCKVCNRRDSSAKSKLCVEGRFPSSSRHRRPTPTWDRLTLFAESSQVSSLQYVRTISTSDWRCCCSVLFILCIENAERYFQSRWRRTEIRSIGTHPSIEFHGEAFLRSIGMSIFPEPFNKSSQPQARLKASFHIKQYTWIPPLNTTSLWIAKDALQLPGPVAWHQILRLHWDLSAPGAEDLSKQASMGIFSCCNPASRTRKTQPPILYTVIYDSENHLSILFQCLGSAWPDVFPFCLFNVMLMVLVTLVDTGDHTALLSNVGHKLIKFVVSFLFVSRVTIALSRFNECRGYLGTMYKESRKCVVQGFFHRFGCC